MEQVKFALPEDGGEMGEELDVQGLDLLVSLLLAHLGHKRVDVTTGSVSVSPLAHLDGELELLLSDLKNFGYLVVLLKFDWEWDSTVLLWSLGELDDLVEVRVKGLGDDFILLFRPVGSAEVEHSTSSLVVELKELAVGSEGVEDVLANVKEEVDAGDDLVLLIEVVNACISQEH